MSVRSSSYFGGLSISSLAASDDQSDNNDEISMQSQQLELYKRLASLEEITNTFLVEQPISLNKDRDSFSEIERHRSQSFELSIDSFEHSDVLTIDVTCLPDFVDETFILPDESMKPPVDHHSLKISLTKSLPIFSKNQFLSNANSSEGNLFSPKLHNGVYSFVLTTAHGIHRGTYVLRVQLADEINDFQQKNHQLIRVSFRVQTAVRAMPIQASIPVPGTVQSGSFCYYRCGQLLVMNVIHLLLLLLLPFHNYLISCSILLGLLAKMRTS